MEPPKIEDIRLDDVDFTDLEEQFAVPEDTTFERYVVVDGAPVAPEAKAAVLTKVLTKLFNGAGKVTNLHMPIEAGKTKGFCFVEFETPQQVEKAIKQLNGKKLDVKHRLFLNRLSDIEKYAIDGAVSDEFVPPPFPEFKETDYLKSWLQDEAGRDQFLMHKGDVTGIFWSKKDQAEPAIEPREHWTQGPIKFSPQGQYLFTMHPQGVQAWGGASFSNLKKFSHPGVRLLDFSPSERYLVTLSPEPLQTPPDDHPRRATYPFGPESDGHKLVIWDIVSGLPVRTFPLPPHLEQKREMIWPLVKWSYDDKYVARMGPGALAIYDTTDNFALVDKKPIKIDDLQDFEFAPAGVKFANHRQQDPLAHVLAYWTPETANQTAKVSILEVPSKKVIRTTNLVQVTDIKLHWQDQGEYLLAKVDRHTKSKKTIFTNMEIFKLNEKDVPVEKVELKDRVVNFQWEPNGDRFVTISRPEEADPNPSIPKNVISFWAPELSKAKVAPLKKWIAFKKFENKFNNTLNFSPRGRFIAISVIGQSASKGSIEFFDLDYTGEKKEGEPTNVDAHVKLLATEAYGGVTDVEWDPSGRFLAAWSSVWRHKIENGYKIFDFGGRLLRDELVDDFKVFMWRPRPESLLKGGDKKKVRKNLREYSAQFDEIDAMEQSTAARELILTRRRLLEEWTSWRSSIESHKEDYGIVEQTSNEEDEEVIEEIMEEIVDEKEEIVEE